VFLDPNTLSDDGTTAITSKTFTDDGTVLAYSLAEKGSDWITVKVSAPDLNELQIKNFSVQKRSVRRAVNRRTERLEIFVKRIYERRNWLLLQCRILLEIHDNHDHTCRNIRWQ
jgi:hypothetical protein